MPFTNSGPRHLAGILPIVAPKIDPTLDLTILVAASVSTQNLRRAPSGLMLGASYFAGDLARSSGRAGVGNFRCWRTGRQLRHCR